MLINNNYFLEVAQKGVPKMNPLSLEYRDFWKREKDRCLNGMWAGGKYMPGKLYFYSNYLKIELNKGKSKRKSLNLPDLRDVEWEFFNHFEKARGLSGFDEARKPLYEGPIKGISLMSGRGIGKSYWATACVSHEYTFYKNNEVLVSAFESKFSQVLLGKVKIALDNIPGDIEFNGEVYPAPFRHRRIKDDWSEEVRSGYKENIGGQEVVRGYNSRIIHRVFKQNHTAANGTRPVLHIFEEQGMFDNLFAAYMASRECWMNGAEQFGTPFLLGTGGDMDRGTVDAQKLFYDPEAYNLLAFIDIYDGTGGKICLFFPTWQGFNQFKKADDTGTLITNEEEALKEVEKRRELAQNAKDKSAWLAELQNQPLKPSEAFLVTTGNIFPIELLQAQLKHILSTKSAQNLGQRGTLEFDRDGNLKWTPESKNNPLFEADYPYNSSNKEGCIVVYEHPPKGFIPFGLYVASTDPYNSDDAENSDSLGSTMIYKRFIGPDKTYDWIVAEYTGRPESSDQYHENVRKLLMYYNAKDLYENMFVGLYAYFKHKGCLHLLYQQPAIIKQITPDSKVNRGYGTHMTKEIKHQCEIWAKNWMLTEYEPGKFNTQKIYSVNLLKELIAYNDKNNFDRAICFLLLMMHLQDVYNIQLVKKEEEQRKKLFKNLFTQAGF